MVLWLTLGVAANHKSRLCGALPLGVAGLQAKRPGLGEAEVQVEHISLTVFV